MLAELNPHLDETDLAILAEIVEGMTKREGPRCGDFIRFSCGAERRIGAVTIWGAQAAKTGSFCIDRGLADHSGAYYFDAIDKMHLVDSGETKAGAAWFFHHGEVRAHNGVNVVAPFRIYTINQEAGR